MKSFNSLPHPCPGGHYWFGERPDVSSPAILRFSEKRLNGRWFLSLGVHGMYWVKEGGELTLAAFETPEQALKKLRHILDPDKVWVKKEK